MPLAFEQSGNRFLAITLQDLQELAIACGFVFPNTGPELPLSRRANMSAFFEVYGVNSASAFIRLFTTTQLPPPWEAGSPSKTKCKRPEAARWTVHESAGATYIGQMRGGRRHGSGLLLTQGTPCLLYVGGFQDGLRHGLGEILTSRGEAYQGHFEEDIMLGPACYVFPRQQALEGAPAPRTMLKFEGIFNGRPMGKGVLFWEDGEEEAGEFDGASCLRRLPVEDCEGVLLLANGNKEAARQQSRAIKGELEAQQLWGQACSLSSLVEALCV